MSKVPRKQCSHQDHKYQWGMLQRSNFLDPNPILHSWDRTEPWTEKLLHPTQPKFSTANVLVPGQLQRSLVHNQTNQSCYSGMNGTNTIQQAGCFNLVVDSYRSNHLRKQRQQIFRFTSLNYSMLLHYLAITNYKLD